MRLLLLQLAGLPGGCLPPALDAMNGGDDVGKAHMCTSAVGFGHQL